jgi:cytohesin
MKWYLGLPLLLCNAAFSAGSDPRLIQAIQNRDQKAVLAMLARGVDVNDARADGSTPLAWAVMRDDAEIAAALIKAGANINAADENGETPLTLAAANGNVTIARMLIESNANVNAARWSGDTPLMAAANCCWTRAPGSTSGSLAWGRRR